MFRKRLRQYLLRLLREEPPDYVGDMLEDNRRGTGTDVLKVMEADGFEMDDTMYFIIRRVSNGHIITVRVYSATRGKNPNQHSPGPPFTDEVTLVPEKESLPEAVTAILVRQALHRR